MNGNESREREERAPRNNENGRIVGALLLIFFCAPCPLASTIKESCRNFCARLKLEVGSYAFVLSTVGHGFLVLKKEGLQRRVTFYSQVGANFVFSKHRLKIGKNIVLFHTFQRFVNQTG